MKPQEAFQQIKNLTELFVRLSLSNEQNFPITHGSASGLYEITISNAANMIAALKNLPYKEIYCELEKARCFNIKMIDGALITFRYRFNTGSITEHVLSYFPSPDLACFQNDPALYESDEIYADVVAKSIIPFPIRFDYSDDSNKFIEIHHPRSHLTLGQYENCRIPVCSPVVPFVFGSFILRNFYNTAYKKYSDHIPESKLFFAKTITSNERKIPHMVCSV